MLFRSVFVLFTTTAIVAAPATAERKCTPAYNDVLMWGTTLTTTSEPSSDTCRSSCIAQPSCAAYLHGNQQCVTLSSVESETYLPTTGFVSARCMDGEALRLLLLPQENAVYSGLDFANAGSPSASDCSRQCQDLPGCHAYSWFSFWGGICSFKSSKPETTTAPYDGSVVSGEVYTCQRPQHNADAVGEDLANVPRPKWTDCCSVCRGTAACGGFAWSNHNGGTCWLKKKITGFTKNAGVVSAVLN